MRAWRSGGDRKSTRLNSSHTEIYTLSLHDALPIFGDHQSREREPMMRIVVAAYDRIMSSVEDAGLAQWRRSEEHTSELQSHRDLHSFPTRRSSDLWRPPVAGAGTDDEDRRRRLRPDHEQRRGCGPGAVA